MTLGEQQRLFTRLIADLVVWAYNNGFELTYGDAYRDKRVFGYFGSSQGYGRARSLHKMRLAVDFNLFINGVYQRSTDAHRPIGEQWESMHHLCAWGGRFDDGNHYSMTRDGYR